MPLRSDLLPYQEVLAVEGTPLAVGTHTFGPIAGDLPGLIFDITRSDDGASGTMTAVVQQWNDATGALESILDGAGNAVDFNDWAAGENVRRTLQIHPTAGPVPSSDADGVFAVGTTGVASDYFRQPVPPIVYLVVTTATDTSTVSILVQHVN